jgi:sarcosine oxidase subunit alpha
VSFAGGPGFEVAVPASRGYELWTTLLGAGERFGIMPYGTEAMHVLRAERGFIIAGQETDGSVTPIDLGFERMLAGRAGFIGQRSLSRPEMLRPDRKQLVGLLSEPAERVLPEGTHVVAEPSASPPVTALGHVTSSYYSANCGRAIALALIKAGRARIGETLYAVGGGRTVKTTVTAPRFLDDAAVAKYG